MKYTGSLWVVLLSLFNRFRVIWISQVCCNHCISVAYPYRNSTCAPQTPQWPKSYPGYETRWEVLLFTEKDVLIQNLTHSFFGFRFSKSRNEMSLNGTSTQNYFVFSHKLLVKDNSWGASFCTANLVLSNLNRLVRRG